MAYFEDEELSKVKAACFRGLARVQLHALHFDHPLVERKHRSISQKNVRRLQRVFGEVGCLRLQEENYINAVVDDASLDKALSLSRDELLCLREGQELPLLDVHVDCLSGLHRIEAAKAILDNNDQWWVVRLFTKETPISVLSRIVELYSNEQRPSDGEIFRKIRLYHRENDPLSEKQWWAYLDNSKLRNLRQLLKNGPLTSAFDSLVDMPGLWANVRLGALNRLLALKCDEEMIRYLKHVKRTWDVVLRCGHDNVPYSSVDAATVAKLENLCPAHSASDKDHVAAMMQDHVLFPLVEDRRLRNALLENITNVSSLIPSLWTFFETLKYLEPICDTLKQLIGTKMKGTIRRSLSGSFFPPEKATVQKSESHTMELKGQLDKAAEIAYIQLWAFCARHFHGLTTFTPRKESGKDKPSVKGPNPVLWQRLARFALNLGFRISVAEKLAAQDSRSSLAIDFLRKANPLSVTFSDVQIQTVVLASSRAAASVEDTPEVSTTQLDVERRCGRPFELDLEDDKRFLFAPIIYRAQDFTAINLQFVRRDLFQSIFGSLRLQEDDFGPPFLSIPAQESSPPTATETRKRTEPSSDSEEYTQKRRRLDYELDQNHKLSGKVASLARENKTLKADRIRWKERYQVAEDENVRLKRRLRILESQGEVPQHDAPAPQPADVSMVVDCNDDDCNDDFWRERSSTRYHDRQRDRSASPERRNRGRHRERNARYRHERDAEVQDESHDAQADNQELGVRQLDPPGHQAPQNDGQAIVHSSTSLSLETLLSLDPQSDLIEELLASHRHRYSPSIALGDYHEIFLVRQIASHTNVDIKGLSFLASSSDAGVRQTETLMNRINAWWAKAMREPGPFIVSRKGKVVASHTATIIHAACEQHGTCFVGSRGDMDNIIQIVNKGGLK